MTDPVRLIEEIEQAVVKAKTSQGVGFSHAYAMSGRLLYEDVPWMVSRILDLECALSEVVNAKALKGVRAQVAGWNGEGKPDGPYERHDPRLGAVVPKTNCGAIYDLDDAMVRASAVLSGGSIPNTAKKKTSNSDFPKCADLAAGRGCAHIRAEGGGCIVPASLPGDRGVLSVHSPGCALRFGDACDCENTSRGCR